MKAQIVARSTTGQSAFLSGGSYIDAGHADRINDFYRECLNPYLNCHRPCAQADVEIDEKGRKRVRSKRYQTPLETLLGLDRPAQYPRHGLNVNVLKRVAGALSDTAVDQFDADGLFDFADALKPLDDCRQAVLDTRPDLRAAGSLPYTHEFLGLFRGWVSRALRRVGANRRHHDRVH